MRFISFFLIFCAAALATDPRPLAAQNLADRDWRMLAAQATVARIENWEEWFVRTQSWVAAMNGVGENGRPTAPFEAIPFGQAVVDIPARWAGLWPCRSILASRWNVFQYDWFRCRLFKSAGQWRIEKTTGSVRFDVWLFRDAKFGAIALGDEWVDIEKRPSRLSDGSTLSKVGFVLRCDGARFLRMFEPQPNGYGILEIDLGR